jgi:Leucine-rich repeat (LRR) protein
MANPTYPRTHVTDNQRDQPTKNTLIQSETHTSNPGLETSDLINIPYELLVHIFRFAVELNGRGDSQTLLNIRLVRKSWKDAIDEEFLNSYWNKIKQIPSFNPPFRGAAAIKTIEENRQGGLERFEELSTTLSRSPALIFPSDYKQHLLDESLKIIWPKVQKQISPLADSIPNDANKIRAWLNDPANAATINQITRLDLSNLELEVLPPEIGNLGQLQTLVLTNTQIKELPAEICKLGQLQTLYLTKTQIKELPAEICKLGQLQTLYLSNTQIKELPAAIGNLGQLQRLNLSNTQIKELPAEICKLGQLQTLVLTNTQIKELPAEIGNLGQLQMLYLSNTQIKELPAEIGNLGKLQWFVLTKTQLKELPAEIGKLGKLQWLDLNGTRWMFTLNNDLSDFVNNPERNYQKYLACRDYKCQTPLAAFCQSIHRSEDDTFLCNKFSQLSGEMQEEILSKLESADLLTKGKGELNNALVEILKAKFSALNEDEKKLVYGRVAELAGEPREDWGKDHAADNIIRLIDALELVSGELSAKRQ